MRHDSQIGVTLASGHACYFVGSLPNPVPGQTVEDVCSPEADFVQDVAARHAEAEGKPAIIANARGIGSRSLPRKPARYDSVLIDLRKMRSLIVVFCSWNSAATWHSSRTWRGSNTFFDEARAIARLPAQLGCDPAERELA